MWRCMQCMSSSMCTCSRPLVSAGGSPYVDERPPAARSIVWQAAQGRVPSLSCHQSYKKPNPYRPTNPSGKGLRWKLSLDQDPSTPTAQVGPGWGTQMHAMRTQLWTKGTIKSLPESRGWIPKPEEGGGEAQGRVPSLSCHSSPWMQ